MGGYEGVRLCWWVGGLPCAFACGRKVGQVGRWVGRRVHYCTKLCPGLLLRMRPLTPRTGTRVITSYDDRLRLPCPLPGRSCWAGGCMQDVFGEGGVPSMQLLQQRCADWH